MKTVQEVYGSIENVPYGLIVKDKYDWYGEVYGAQIEFGGEPARLMLDYTCGGWPDMLELSKMDELWIDERVTQLQPPNLFDYQEEFGLPPMGTVVLDESNHLGKIVDYTEVTEDLIFAEVQYENASRNWVWEVSRLLVGCNCASEEDETVCRWCWAHGKREIADALATTEDLPF